MCLCIYHLINDCGIVKGGFTSTTTTTTTTSTTTNNNNNKSKLKIIKT